MRHLTQFLSHLKIFHIQLLSNLCPSLLRILSSVSQFFSLSSTTSPLYNTHLLPSQFCSQLLTDFHSLTLGLHLCHTLSISFTFFHHILFLLSHLSDLLWSLTAAFIFDPLSHPVSCFRNWFFQDFIFSKHIFCMCSIVGKVTSNV